jgi:hypothetical protein
MKTSLHAAVLLLSATAALSAPVALTGYTTYTQDFNTLPNVGDPAGFTWADDATLPSWFATWAGAGFTTRPPLFGHGSPLQVSDGSASVVQGVVYSAGQVGASDRFLVTSPNFSPSATRVGEASAYVIFQNNSGETLELTKI